MAFNNVPFSAFTLHFHISNW